VEERYLVLARRGKSLSSEAPQAKPEWNRKCHGLLATWSIRLVYIDLCNFGQGPFFEVGTDDGAIEMNWR
jgi:hypothetical protein